MADPVRLAKRVAAQMPCSRREAELYITGGRVRVDGVLVREPQERVADTQRVDIDTTAAGGVSATTLVAHKAAGQSGAQLQATLPPEYAGLAPLLPLPALASGLAVFSNDKRIVRKLTEDALVIEQEIIAQVAGTIVPDGLALMAHGLVHEGRALPPAKVSWQNETRLRFALKGIPPERVGWMCAQAGLQLEGLKRIRIGRLPMAQLPPGEWRVLHEDERF
jgi:23S rRNA pseudouridine2604 synthase